MTDELRWTPVSGLGDPITIGAQAPYFWSGHEGLASQETAPQTVRAPFQPGETLIDSEIHGRRCSLSITIAANSREELWTYRADLARAFAVPPRLDHLTPPQLGTLRITREGHDDLVLRAVPVSSPEIEAVSRTTADVQVELLAPSPWWEDVTDNVQELFDVDGGLGVPMTTGLGVPMTTGLGVPFNLSSAEIFNLGQVPTPTRMEFLGEITNPRLRNLSTGESIQLIGSLAAGERLVVETEFGRKRITHVATDGTETQAFDWLDQTDADFWWLQRGVNDIRLEFSEVVDGSARVFHRERFAGV